MAYRYLTITTMLLLLTASCGLNDLDDQVIVPAVEDEFYLSMWESFSPDKRALEFRLRTIEDANCKNARISHEVKHFQGAIQFSIREIALDADCEPGAAPATGVAAIGTLKNGLYSLEVRLREKVTAKGQLSISPEAFDISLARGGGIILLHRQLRRVPEQTIWGFVDYTDISLAQEAQRLLQDIVADSELLTLRNGDYGHFAIQDGTLRLPNTIAPPSAQTFYYRYAGSKEQMLALLESYRAAHEGKLAVKIFNTLGEEW